LEIDYKRLRSDFDKDEKFPRDTTPFAISFVMLMLVDGFQNPTVTVTCPARNKEEEIEAAVFKRTIRSGIESHLTQTDAPERHVLFFSNRTSRLLLRFQLLSYASKFHETKSGSGTKNAAHHDNNLHVHWRGLLSRRGLATAQTYTPTASTVSQKDTAKRSAALLAF
jgi:hypothetical protein